MRTRRSLLAKLGVPAMVVALGLAGSACDDYGGGTGQGEENQDDDSEGQY